jgi:Ran GTPase-activating protein (RanGAP) involved in mRNA processing and transport
MDDLLLFSLSVYDSWHISIFVLELTGDHNYQLEDLIVKCESRSTVDLSYQQLTDRDMTIVVKHAIIKKRCIFLNLSSNQITSEGVAIISDAIQRQTTALEKLDLDGNCLSDVSVSFLARALSTNDVTLKILHVNSNDISAVGAEHLAQMLKSNRTLIQLWLKRNPINNRGIEFLANALAHHNTTLEELYISFDLSIDDLAIDSLVELIENNSSLKKLCMTTCNMLKNQKERLQAVSSLKNDFQLFI